MLPKAETACFAIADISGYTHFVSGVELDHAQDIIADIMDTLVRALRPPFRLAKFEGDAAFVYALADKVDGSLLQDSIEQAYFAFRKRLRSIKQASSCECQACSRMQSLDQVRDSSRRVHPAEDVGPRGARRPGRDPHSPPAQERRQQNVRPARLCALFRRLRACDGDRSRGAGSSRTCRGDRAYRRNEVLGERPRRGVDGGGEGGTHFEFRIAKPKPKDLPFYERVRPTLEANFTAGFDILRTMVAERAAASTVEDEPPLPVSRERFLTQPVHEG
jgi:hypothetical protein